MRKFWLFITTLVTFGFLAGASWAGTVDIGGTHSADEIRGICSEVGGTLVKMRDSIIATSSAATPYKLAW
jgi:hypothetical protein